MHRDGPHASTELSVADAVDRAVPGAADSPAADRVGLDADDGDPHRPGDSSGVPTHAYDRCFPVAVRTAA